MSTGSQNLSDIEFISFCYELLLKRPVDEQAESNFKSGLENGDLSREQLLIRIITSEEYRLRTDALEFVPPGHFYSAVPSLADREAMISEGRGSIESVPGIALNGESQLNLLKEFKAYFPECPFPNKKTGSYRYCYDNPAYSFTDALTLYSMMCHFKPNRVIEIGSGFSSCAMLDTNDSVFDGQIKFTFIEPFPELLHSLLERGDKKHIILDQGVQDVDLSVFQQLQTNDILFVDSTHVSKLNSDVNKILFDILPTLKKGTLVHFHDIFWPFEYPNDWIAEGRAWNEAYILRAFLQFNQDFEIIFFANYLHSFHETWFAENMPLYLKNLGGNIWLRKIAD